MKTRTITTFTAIAAACFAGSSAYAGTYTAPPSKPVKEQISESCITGDLGFDVVSEYISKGIVVENQGFIIQPYADLHFRLYKSSDLISSITADIGIWNSFNDQRTNLAASNASRAAAVAQSQVRQSQQAVRAAQGVQQTAAAARNLQAANLAAAQTAARAANLQQRAASSTTGTWNEFDFTAGLTFTIDKFSIAPQFRVYESPADSFSNVYTMGLNLSYDDKDLLGDFSLHPHAFVELELIKTNGNGSRPNGSGANGQYYEVGIAPNHKWGDITVTLPITAGFGTGDFYAQNIAFGFFSAGVDVAYAMNFVPQCLGAWSVHTGATYYRLGTGAAYSAPPYDTVAPVSTPGEKNQWVFSAGMKVAF